MGAVAGGTGAQEARAEGVRRSMVNAFFYGAGLAAAAMGARLIIQGSTMVAKGGGAGAAAAKGAEALGGMGGMTSRLKSFMPGGGVDKRGFEDPMTRREAFHILGLKEG